MQLGVGAMCNLKKNVSTCKMDEKCFICANYYEVYPTCKKNGGMIIVETYPTQVRRKRILVAGWNGRNYEWGIESVVNDVDVNKISKLIDLLMQ